MSYSMRTAIYGIVAVVSVSAAYFTWRSTVPQDSAEFEKVGQAFYPDFQDPKQATSLTVVGFDEKLAVSRTFSVEKVDGVWRIPSHYNYPADAEARLYKTAASILDVKRGALASRNEKDHERLGVVDPSQDGLLKGGGTRITIKKGNEVLADYIVGKEFEKGSGRYYVRVPDEKETYVAEFKPDLSTKFSDWIDVKLLNIDNSKLTDLDVVKYSLDLSRGGLAFGDFDISDLHRDKAGDPWTLAGLDEQTQEVDSTKVNDLLQALSKIEIQGVRPKPEGLRPDLTFDPKLASDWTNLDLQSRGYVLADKEQLEKQVEALKKAGKAEFAEELHRIISGSSSEYAVFSQEGSFYAGLNDGMLYTFHFGNVFTGDLSEIEIGKPADESKDGETGEEKAKADEAEGKQDADKEDAGADDEKKADDESLNRYLLVKVEFDPKYLGPEPVKPTAPEPPPEASAPEKQEEAKDSAEAKESGEANEKPAENKPSGGKTKSNNDNNGGGGTLFQDNGDEPLIAAQPGDAPLVAPKPPEEPKVDPVATYEILKKQYEKDLAQYEKDLEDYNKRKKEGETKAAELSKRLGAWYYVISTKNVDALQVKRASLIKPKGADESPAGGRPGIPNFQGQPGFPGLPNRN